MAAATTVQVGMATSIVVPLSVSCRAYLSKVNNRVKCLAIYQSSYTMILFIRLIIRLFRFIFSAEIVFFSHNKSANSVFQPAYQHIRTGPIVVLYLSKKKVYYIVPCLTFSFLFLVDHLCLYLSPPMPMLIDCMRVKLFSLLSSLLHVSKNAD
jgi:hypothetical protein